MCFLFPDNLIFSENPNLKKCQKLLQRCSFGKVCKTFHVRRFIVLVGNAGHRSAPAASPSGRGSAAKGALGGRSTSRAPPSGPGGGIPALGPQPSRGSGIRQLPSLRPAGGCVLPFALRLGVLRLGLGLAFDAPLRQGGPSRGRGKGVLLLGSWEIGQWCWGSLSELGGGHAAEWRSFGAFLN